MDLFLFQKGIKHPDVEYTKTRGDDMLRKKDLTDRNQVTMVSLEELVPKDHLVRKIEAAMDFSFIYDLVEDLYSDDKGRPSIDPVVLIKICMIKYIFGIRSMRQTIKEIETNLAYRWFIGYGLQEDIPHFTTFSKNYARRFEGTKLFDSIFNRILMQAVEEGFVDPTMVFVDGTHVKASANKNKRVKVLVKEQTRSYRKELEKEIDEVRKAHGQKPLKKNYKVR